MSHDVREAGIATKGTTITKDLFALRIRLGLRGLIALVCFVSFVAAGYAQELPELTKPVNDFANVVDPASEQRMEAIIRSLQEATGDVVVVATVGTIAPYGNAREYATKLFENRGRGIGERDKDNGLLILVAVKERRVEVEVGYDLEQFITDGFSGETSRQFMLPEFRSGNYGAGLLAGVERIVSRIAEQRNVTLQGVPRAPAPSRTPQTGSGGSLILALFIAFIVINAIAGRLRGAGHRQHWGGRRRGWNSGVGPFGGGFGGGLGGGGGFGGGFGGFGGGRSGGGGGGASW